MKKGFNILQTNPYENTDEILKDYYFHWREFNKGNSDTKEKFTILFSSFKENYLADIEGGPLKLYLFFCFSASNQDGDSWYSVEKIASVLKVGPRTINKWIKVLVDKQLIYRDQANHKSLTTYLLPYSTTLMPANTKGSYTEDTQIIVEEISDSLKSQEKVFGELTGIFHLFQWTSSKRKKARNNNKNVQWLLFITKRPNGILTGHYYELKNSNNTIVSVREIDDSYFFHSPFKFQSTPVLGIALNNEIDITDNPFEPLKQLVEQLATIDISSIDPKQFIDYKPIEEEEIEIEID